MKVVCTVVANFKKRLCKGYRKMAFFYAFIFFDKNQREIQFTPKEFNLWNSDSWYFLVESGDILIFPSNLEHMVETVEESENRDVRISLAFNTFVKGKLGNYGTSTELIL